jgi:hypothetical protein
MANREAGDAAWQSLENEVAANKTRHETADIDRILVFQYPRWGQGLQIWEIRLESRQRGWSMVKTKVTTTKNLYVVNRFANDTLLE